MDRIILHSDLNGFYASVECHENPELRGFPVAVCGDAEQRHGIVLAKNELAKRFNVKTGDVIWEAKKKCPDLVIVRADHKKYIRYSKIVNQIYYGYTNKVESFGIDESWLDVSNRGLDIKDGERIANEIRQQIKDEVGITASIGVSWNKIFAKLGSDIKKSDATTVISRENYKQVIFPLPVQDLLYVGRATKAKLNEYKIYTIGQLANSNKEFLKKLMGKNGELIWTFANGLDNSSVSDFIEESATKSVGNSTTCARDLITLDDIKMIITVLAESVSARLREQNLKGQVVHLWVRDKNFKGWGKQQKIKKSTNLSQEIIDTAMQLFESFYHFSQPVRALGITLSDITSNFDIVTNKQLSIFDMLDEKPIDAKDVIKNEALDLAIKSIRGRFGQFAISRGIEHLDKGLTDFNPSETNVIFPVGYLK